MATIAPPLPPDPLAVGLGQFFGGLAGGKIRKHQRGKAVNVFNEDLELFRKSQLDPNSEEGQQFAQERFGKGLPLLQGQNLHGETGTASPDFKSPSFVQQLGQMQLQQQAAQDQANTPAAQAKLAETKARTALLTAQASVANEPKALSPTDFRHRFALLQGSLPGSEEYDRFVNGPNKETMSDFLLGVVKEKQAGRDVKGFENLTAQDVAKLSSASTENIINNNPAPSGERTTIVQLQNVLKTAQRLKSTFNPDHVGLVKEFSAGLRELLPENIPGAMPTEEAVWRSDLASLIELMYATSGKQLSDRERKVVNKMFPKGSYNKENFPPVLDRFIQRVAQRTELSQSALEEAGFIAPGRESNIFKGLKADEAALVQQLRTQGRTDSEIRAIIKGD